MMGKSNGIKNEKMNKRYRIAVSSANMAPATAPIPLTGNVSENLKYASQLGYDAIEIHMRENEDADFDEIRKACDAYHIRISAVVTGMLCTQEKVSLTDANQQNAEKAMKGIKKYIDIASELNTDIIIGWIRGKILDIYTKEQYNKLLAEKLGILSEYSDKKDVKIMVEAINRYEINSLNTGSEIVELINQYGLENVYAHLDTFHMNIEEVDIAAAISRCGSNLGYVHFADSNRRYPGAGHIDFDSIMEALDQIEYGGYISIECLPLPTPEKAMYQAEKYMGKYNSI